MPSKSTIYLGSYGNGEMNWKGLQIRKSDYRALIGPLVAFQNQVSVRGRFGDQIHPTQSECPMRVIIYLAQIGIHIKCHRNHGEEK